MAHSVMKKACLCSKLRLARLNYFWFWRESCNVDTGVLKQHVFRSKSFAWLAPRTGRRTSGTGLGCGCLTKPGTVMQRRSFNAQ